MNNHSLQVKQGLSLLLLLNFLMMGTSCGGGIPLGPGLMTNAAIMFLAEQVRVLEHRALSNYFTLLISLTVVHTWSVSVL